MVGVLLHIDVPIRGEDILFSHSKVISCLQNSVRGRGENYVPFNLCS